MRHVVTERGLADAFHIESAGTGSWHLGAPADPRSRGQWESRGLTHDHMAQQFSPDDLERFDLVLAMDSSNLDALQRMARAVGSHTAIDLLRAYDPTAGAGAEVPDPYYGGADGFVDVFDMVDRACRGLVDHLVAEGRVPPGDV